MPKGVYERDPPEVRFWRLVNRDGPLHELLGTKCWLWLGGKIRGYGHFWYKGKTVKAYRFSLGMVIKIPKDKHVLHKCDNPPCVNPDHLFLGDYITNRQDCVSKGRQARGEKHGSRTKPGSGAKGERITSSVLTEELVRKLRKEYVKGCKLRGTYGLARKYDLHQATVWSAVSGSNWKHVN